MSDLLLFSTVGLGFALFGLILTFRPDIPIRVVTLAYRRFYRDDPTWRSFPEFFDKTPLGWWQRKAGEGTSREFLDKLCADPDSSPFMSWYVRALGLASIVLALPVLAAALAEIIYVDMPEFLALGIVLNTALVALNYLLYGFVRTRRLVFGVAAVPLILMATGLSIVIGVKAYRGLSPDDERYFGLSLIALLAALPLVILSLKRNGSPEEL